MVLLMEYAPGLAMKRKGAEEPALFACPGDSDGDGDGAGLPPLSCRATKIRRLQSAGHHHDVPVAPAVASVGTAEGDVMMGEEPAPSPGDADGEGAMVVYDPADAAGWRRLGLLSQWRRLRPWAHLCAGAEWISDMLREADSRTVREVLARDQEEGAANLAVVPWGAAPAPAATEAASTAAETVDGEEDAEGTAAMDVEEERGNHRTQTFGAGCREGHLYRWPQHCMAPPPLPAVGHASPVMWSW